MVLYGNIKMKNNNLDNFEKVGVHCEGRIIKFFDDVENSSVLQTFIFLDALEKQNKKPITIVLCSGGGCIYAGLSLYDRIRSCKCKVTIVGTGVVASIASIIFLAGDVRIGTKHLRIMLHEGALENNNGSASLTRSEQREIDVLEDVANDIVEERTKLSKKNIEKLMLGKNYYFGAEEALNNGYIHEIIDEVSK